ncbi:hypothetical protein O977_05490 [Mycobacterium avium subsp. paratuberculosis 10-5975]|nr:hypothetical protein O977_05490 [Mycobacterium avium subsp. paratuberculosis 10-5975]
MTNSPTPGSLSPNGISPRSTDGTAYPTESACSTASRSGSTVISDAVSVMP